MYPFNPNKPTLYTSKICPFAHRVVTCLAETGVDYETSYIDLNNKPEWYPLVNPASKVPAMRLPNGEILVESLIIAEYLCDLYPKFGLMPESPLDRYKVRIFIDYFGSNLLSSPYVLLRNGDNEDKHAKLEEIVKNLHELNRRLVECSPEGPFFLGERFTLADIATFPFIERLYMATKMFGLSIDNIPGLERFYQWTDAVRNRPSYKSTVASYDELVTAYQKYLPK
ncbi:hypothetical protein BB559_006797 [Furculomyces boomerangus]|uniref:GST N-terminal domain-containing protein n=2 Tax=Harpellales TaxID=61421 RepID=A0A2T9Y0M4_9FUNG|nr:hypothetical protein BB559_006797 [Furculomyces boomerangus]PWA03174.1 hypothetical protein BB558_000661 [Smittium angustum]